MVIMAPRKKAPTGDSAPEPAKPQLASYERKRDFGKTPEPSGHGAGEQDRQQPDSQQPAGKKPAGKTPDHTKPAIPD
ncbi:MAG TPA: hypothetical protein VGD68_17185, partial [Streptosporangiaceae bacterium]